MGKGMTGNRAIKILEWAEGTLKWAAPDKLTAFERELLAKCNEIEIAIAGYGRVPAIHVRDIKPTMKLVFEDGYWEVESIHKVDNNLFEIALCLWAHGGVKVNERKIIRKRYSTLLGYIR